MWHIMDGWKLLYHAKLSKNCSPYVLAFMSIVLTALTVKCVERQAGSSAILSSGKYTADTWPRWAEYSFQFMRDGCHRYLYHKFIIHGKACHLFSIYTTSCRVWKLKTLKLSWVVFLYFYSGQHILSLIATLKELSCLLDQFQRHWNWLP